MREALDAAGVTPGPDKLSEMYEAVKGCANALGVTDNLRGSRRGTQADAIRAAIRGYELAVFGDRWRVVPNEGTGQWDVFDSRDTLVTSMDNESRAQLIAKAPEMLAALRDAIATEEGNWNGPHDLDDSNSEPSWMADARAISDELKGVDEQYSSTPGASL